MGMVLIGLTLALGALLTPTADGWLRWLAVVVGIAAAMTMILPDVPLLRYGPLAAGMLLLGAGIVAVGAQGPTWLPWGTFFFSALFLALGLFVLGTKDRHVPRRHGSQPV